MKNSSVYAFLLSSFLLFVSVRSDLIQTTCNKAFQAAPNLDLHFCVEYLEVKPKVIAAKTLEDLLPVVVDIATEKATEVATKISKLVEDKSMDAAKKGCLEICSKVYSEALSNLATAGQSTAKKDYRTAIAVMSSAMESPKTCEDGFKEKPGLTSPLTKENDEVFQLATIAVAFGTMVKA